MAALLGRLGELGYGWAYRVLDAQHFGVPQRRRRVFIVALDAQRGIGAERAAEVLSVGSRCRRHPPTGVEAGPGTAEGVALGVDVARAVTGTSGKRHDDDTDTLIPIAPIRGNPYSDHIGDEERLIVSSSPDPGGVRAPDGLAGRLDDRGGVAYSVRPRSGMPQGWNANLVSATLNSGGFRTEPGEHLVYRKATKAHNADDWERWETTDRVDTLDAEGLGALQATAIVGALREHVRPGSNTDHSVLGDFAAAESDLLPLGLDSHRYRCCGNGVVSSVSEWIGRRLLENLR